MGKTVKMWQVTASPLDGAIVDPNNAMPKEFFHTKKEALGYIEDFDGRFWEFGEPELVDCIEKKCDSGWYYEKA